MAERLLLKKVTGKLIPFMFVLYIIAYLDRVNVGFAKLQMNQLPWFSESIYGIGSGIFFLGYFLFEVPSNLILERVGARRWIARIMLTWGVMAVGMLFTNSVRSFYIMRFLLGIAEAGFFPGMILYLTYWYTAKERASMIASFMIAIPFANIIGSPISGMLLSLKIFGLAGWQSLFLLEGLPAILLAFVVLRYLPDGPQSAKWLNAEEADHLQHRIAIEQDLKQDKSHGSLKTVISHPVVWQLCLIYFTLNVGSYGIGMWLPQIIKKFGNVSNTQTGFLTAIPHIAGALGLYLNGRHSDKTQERRLHVAFGALVGGIGLLMSAYITAPAGQLLSLAIALAGFNSMLAPFWTLPSTFLVSAAAAGGIAFINSVGNLGGFVGPYLLGILPKPGGDFRIPLTVLSVFLFVGFILTYTLRRDTIASVYSNSED